MNSKSLVGYYGNRLTFTINSYPMWKRGGLCLRDNGGRLPKHCLDITLIVWKTDICLTIHPLGCLSKLIWWLPDGYRGRGLCFGLLPRGAAE